MVNSLVPPWVITKFHYWYCYNKLWWEFEHIHYGFFTIHIVVNPIYPLWKVVEFHNGDLNIYHYEKHHGFSTHPIAVNPIYPLGEMIEFHNGDLSINHYGNYKKTSWFFYSSHSG